MGTDIHMVVQALVGDSWETRPHSFGDGNYALFAALAGVRNGFGFAGVNIHEPILPISDPRGLPADFALNRRPPEDDENEEDVHSLDDDPDCHGDQWMGDHSHSWLTLNEILAYDWDQPLSQTAVIGLDAFRSWDGKSYPDDASGSVSGTGILTISAAEARERIRTNRWEPTKAQREWAARDEAQFGRPPPTSYKFYVQVQWVSSLNDSIGPDWFHFLGMLRAEYGLAPGSVRLVFGFDS